jgi:hypothetical protein
MLKKPETKPKVRKEKTLHTLNMEGFGVIC